MKRFLITLCLSIAFIAPFMSVNLTRAATDPLKDVCAVTDASGNKSPNCPTGSSDPVSGTNGIIVKVSQLIGIFVGVAAVVVIIMGGLQYILSSGDPARINEAKNTILYAIIGLVIAIVAPTLVALIVRSI